MLHPRKSILASLACAALIAVTGTSAAQAAPRADDTLTETVARETADTSAISRVTSDATASASASDRQRIADYWTPERKRNALVPVLTTDASGAITKTLQSQAAARGLDDGGIIDYLEDSPIAGKLFYRDQLTNTDQTCSATVVDAPSESLVMTAAHCLKSPGNGTTDGIWYEDIVFVPGYTSTNQPAFVWFTMMVTQRWTKYGDRARDVGTVAVEKRQGFTLEDFAGNGATFVYNQGINNSHDIITQAYPKDIDNAQRQVTCTAMTGNAAGTFTEYGIAISPCNLGPGASGSGWIRNWGEINHEIVGLTSQGNIVGNNFSPYFDSNTNVQYTSMKNEFPPA
ncbi:hypothetical protein B2J88_46340 [Rhodococcus sp. SRB_17]|nr:hypothetical protein [Rhodococcus sp. SRB_17]